MPTLSFEERANSDFKKLIEKYGKVVLLINPDDEEEKMCVSMNCDPESFFMLIEKLFTEFLRSAKRKGHYEIVKEMIHIAVAKAEMAIEFSEISKSKKCMNEDKADFAKEMMGLLFKSMLEDDSNDDDD